MKGGGVWCGVVFFSEGSRGYFRYFGKDLGFGFWVKMIVEVVVC